MATGYQPVDRDVSRSEPLSRSGNPGHVQSGEIGHWDGIIAKFLATIRSRVPLGYEDKTGFHVGIMSPEE
jgi:hypothetical protein